MTYFVEAVPSNENDAKLEVNLVRQKRTNNANRSPSLPKSNIDDQNRCQQLLPDEEDKFLDNQLPVNLRRMIYTNCKSGNADELRGIVEHYISSNELTDSTALKLYLSSPVANGNVTFLHMAASSGHEKLLRLLLDFGADPAIKASYQNGSSVQQMVPFQVAKSKQVRQVFIDFRKDSKPDLWDWNLAQIPPPVDEEEEKIR